MNKILGIDIGRVIINGDGHPGGDTAFFQGGLENAVRTPPMPGAFDTIANLVDLFGGRVWLVSKCGPRVQERTLAWLAAHQFHGITRVPEANVLFCRERADKAIHCQAIRASHFIDDRLDVLGHLRGLVDHLFLFGAQKRECPYWATQTLTWEDVRSAIEGTDGRSSADESRSC